MRNAKPRTGRLFREDSRSNEQVRHRQHMKSHILMSSRLINPYSPMEALDALNAIATPLETLPYFIIVGKFPGDVYYRMTMRLEYI